MENTLCKRLEALVERELEEIAEAGEHRNNGLSRVMVGNMHDLLESMLVIHEMGTLK